RNVTGVQTCALPISAPAPPPACASRATAAADDPPTAWSPPSTTTPSPPHCEVTGQPTGTVRPSCVNPAETSAVCPGVIACGASTLISSTHGRVSAANHATRSVVVGLPPTSPRPGSTPSIVQPVNPPFAGVPDGFFPELPLIM